MNRLLELMAELEACDPDVSGNADRFEALLAEVIALRTPESISHLMRLFRDNSEFDELMFSIIHGIEVFDDRTYLAEVLRNAAWLCAETPRWASIIFMRILNAEPARLELVRQLRGADPATKLAVRTLMEKINAESVQFMPKTLVVIVAAY